MRQPIVLTRADGTKIVVGPGWIARGVRAGTEITLGEEPEVVIETVEEIANATDALHVISDDVVAPRQEEIAKAEAEERRRANEAHRAHIERLASMYPRQRAAASAPKPKDDRRDFLERFGDAILGKD